MSKITKLRTGHTVEDQNPEEFERMVKNFPMYDGSVRIYPGGWLLSKHAPEFLDKVYDFKFRPTDIMVNTYPKSGTTWMLEIVWTLLHNPDLQSPKANIDIDLRAPHLEMDMVIKPPKVPNIEDAKVFMDAYKEVASDRMDDEFKGLTYLERLKDPRVIKCHLPIALLPQSFFKTSKMIYIVRDARDVIISKAHWWKVLAVHSYRGSFDEFVDYFINEEQYSHPYWQHVKDAYDMRNHPNLLFLYFEDIKANTAREVKKICEFLGIDRNPQQIQNVVEHTNFINMKKRTDEGKMNEPMSAGGLYINKLEDNTKGFFRKGEAGSGKSKFTEEQDCRISKWMTENLEQFDDEFRYKQMVK